MQRVNDMKSLRHCKKHKILFRQKSCPNSRPSINLTT